MEDVIVLTLVGTFKETILKHLPQHHLITLLIRSGSILTKGINHGIYYGLALANTMKDEGN